MRASAGSLGRVVLVAVLVAAFVSGCGRTPPAVDPSKVGVERFEPGERPQLPPVAGTTLAGTPLDLAELRGDVVVLNSWASWCGPCLIEMPILIDAADRYRERGVTVVGLNTLDEQANATAFVEDLGITFDSIRDADGAILATLPDVPPRALPNTLIIDPQGDIAARIIGPVDEPMLTDIIDDILGESARDMG